MKIRLVGTSYRQAPVEIRERLALPEGALPEALRTLHALPGVREVALISTCNRVEVVIVEDSPSQAGVQDVLAGWARMAPQALEEHLMSEVDEAACRHLFRVTSSLDSMVLGESQITGQVKDAYRHASEAGSLGPILHRLFQKAFGVAKRVRTETGVGSSTLSVARAAVDMADAVFDELRKHKVLLLGAGEMAELALRGFRDKGCRDLWVSNRTLRRAAEVAAPLDAAVLPWSRRAEFLETVDIVVASTAARGSVLSKRDVLAVRRKRRGRPLLLIDISVPRNLDEAINELDSVYLFDIDDLGRVVSAGREARLKEAEKAQAIVDGEVLSFSRVLAQVHVAPLLRALNQRVSRDGRQEVERTLMNLQALLEPLGSEANGELRAALDRMVHSLGKRFLHGPMQRIRQLGGEGEVDLLEEAALLLGVEATLLSVRELDDLAAAEDFDSGRRSGEK